MALNGTQGLELVLTDEQNGVLNPLGVNCLRSFPIIGRVIWGARTLRGADLLADEYKYVPIRRLALFIEESLYPVSYTHLLRARAAGAHVPDHAGEADALLREPGAV